MTDDAVSGDAEAAIGTADAADAAVGTDHAGTTSLPPPPPLPPNAFALPQGNPWRTAEYLIGAGITLGGFALLLLASSTTAGEFSRRQLRKIDARCRSRRPGCGYDLGGHLELAGVDVHVGIDARLGPSQPGQRAPPPLQPRPEITHTRWLSAPADARLPPRPASPRPRPWLSPGTPAGRIARRVAAAAAAVVFCAPFPAATPRQQQQFLPRPFLGSEFCIPPRVKSQAIGNNNFPPPDRNFMLVYIFAFARVAFCPMDAIVTISAGGVSVTPQHHPWH